MKKLPFSIVLQALILPFNFLQNIDAGVTVTEAILSSIVKFYSTKTCVYNGKSFIQLLDSIILDKKYVAICLPITPPIK